ncbi:MAG: phospholipid scramblase-related protein [Psychrobium sp.]
MEKLANHSSLMIKQQKEWGEIITGFETLNKYVISDAAGGQLYFAAEQKGSWLARQFFKASRPFTLAVLDGNSQQQMTVSRPFRWLFPEATIYGQNGKTLGVVKKHFSLISKKYSLFDAQGRVIYTLKGPLLKPWTFNIRQGERDVGKITKKWSGLLKESFSDADNFGVIFPDDADVETKAFLLGVVFLIDFVHFENKGD